MFFEKIRPRGREKRYREEVYAKFRTSEEWATCRALTQRLIEDAYT